MFRFLHRHVEQRDAERRGPGGETGAHSLLDGLGGHFGGGLRGWLDGSWRRGASTETPPAAPPTAVAPPAAPPAAPAAAPAAPAATGTSSGQTRVGPSEGAPAAEQPVSLKAKVTADLDAVKANGLTAAELGAIYGSARSQTGDNAAADAALQGALGPNLGHLTRDGASWVQENLATMDGKIGQYQNVFGAYQDGAQLIDANFNGTLDQGDVGVKPGDGGGRAQALDQETIDRVKLNSNVVEAAYDMAAAKHDFVANFDQQTFNSDYWERDPSGAPGTFKPKEGVSPSDAMKDVFNNPDKYKFECATAMVLTYYSGLEKTLGKEKFDALGKDLRVGPWEQEEDLDRGLEFRGAPGQEAPAGFESGLKPGQHAYMRNWDVSSEGRELGWQGENLINLGNGLYYGHPFGIVDSSQVEEKLNRHRNPGSTREASFVDMVADLSTFLV